MCHRFRGAKRQNLLRQLAVLHIIEAGKKEHDTADNSYRFFHVRGVNMFTWLFNIFFLNACVSYAFVQSAYTYVTGS